MSELTRYRINEPDVSSENIDGEVIIVNLVSGHYYSTAEVGAYIWGQISTGPSGEELLGNLLSAYRDNGEGVRGDLDGFLGKLEEEGLITRHGIESSHSSQWPGTVEIQAELPRRYSTPSLSCYSDMEDLLALDPIHEVTGEGWPNPKPAPAWPTGKPVDAE